MANVLLFSQLNETNKDSILKMLFSSKNRSFAYMPSGGFGGAKDYTAQWKNIANEYDAQLEVINNTSSDTKEKDKLLNADVLLISGGNSFQLLNNLRKSGLDQAIIEFARRPDVTLAGFSAGALVLTPTIAIGGLPCFDENLVGLDDLSGLYIVDFEVFPHYNLQLHESTLREYQKTTSNPVRKITDEEYILVKPSAP